VLNQTKPRNNFSEVSSGAKVSTFRPPNSQVPPPRNFSGGSGPVTSGSETIPSGLRRSFSGASAGGISVDNLRNSVISYENDASQRVRNFFSQPSVSGSYEYQGIKFNSKAGYEAYVNKVLYGIGNPEFYNVNNVYYLNQVNASKALYNEYLSSVKNSGGLYTLSLNGTTYYFYDMNAAEKYLQNYVLGGNNTLYNFNGVIFSSVSQAQDYSVKYYSSQIKQNSDGTYSVLGNTFNSLNGAKDYINDYVYSKDQNFYKVNNVLFTSEQNAENAEYNSLLANASPSLSLNGLLFNSPKGLEAYLQDYVYGKNNPLYQVNGKIYSSEQNAQQAEYNEFLNQALPTLSFNGQKFNSAAGLEAYLQDYVYGSNIPLFTYNGVIYSNPANLQSAEFNALYNSAVSSGMSLNGVKFGSASALTAYLQEYVYGKNNSLYNVNGVLYSTQQEAENAEYNYLLGQVSGNSINGYNFHSREGLLAYLNYYAYGGTQPQFWNIGGLYYHNPQNAVEAIEAQAVPSGSQISLSLNEQSYLFNSLAGMETFANQSIYGGNMPFISKNGVLYRGIIKQENGGYELAGNLFHSFTGALEELNYVENGGNQPNYFGIQLPLSNTMYFSNPINAEKYLENAVSPVGTGYQLAVNGLSMTFHSRQGANAWINQYITGNQNEQFYNLNGILYQGVAQRTSAGYYSLFGQTFHSLAGAQAELQAAANNKAPPNFINYNNMLFLTQSGLESYLNSFANGLTLSLPNQSPVTFHSEKGLQDYINAIATGNQNQKFYPYNGMLFTSLTNLENYALQQQYNSIVQENGLYEYQGNLFHSLAGAKAQANYEVQYSFLQSEMENLGGMNNPFLRQELESIKPPQFYTVGNVNYLNESNAEAAYISQYPNYWVVNGQKFSSYNAALNYATSNMITQQSRELVGTQLESIITGYIKQPIYKDIQQLVGYNSVQELVKTIEQPVYKTVQELVGYQTVQELLKTIEQPIYKDIQQLVGYKSIQELVGTIEQPVYKDVREIIGYKPLYQYVEEPIYNDVRSFAGYIIGGVKYYESNLPSWLKGIINWFGSDIATLERILGKSVSYLYNTTEQVIGYTEKYVETGLLPIYKDVPQFAGYVTKDVYKTVEQPIYKDVEEITGYVTKNIYNDVVKPIYKDVSQFAGYVTKNIYNTVEQPIYKDVSQLIGYTEQAVYKNIEVPIYNEVTKTILPDITEVTNSISNSANSVLKNIINGTSPAINLAEKTIGSGLISDVTGISGYLAKPLAATETAISGIFGKLTNPISSAVLSASKTNNSLVSQSILNGTASPREVDLYNLSKNAGQNISKLNVLTEGLLSIPAVSKSVVSLYNKAEIGGQGLALLGGGIYVEGKTAISDFSNVLSGKMANLEPLPNIHQASRQWLAMNGSENNMVTAGQIYVNLIPVLNGAGHFAKHPNENIVQKGLDVGESILSILPFIGEASGLGDFASILGKEAIGAGSFIGLGEAVNYYETTSSPFSLTMGLPKFFQALSTGKPLSFTQARNMGIEGAGIMIGGEELSGINEYLLGSKVLGLVGQDSILGSGWLAKGVIGAITNTELTLPFTRNPEMLGISAAVGFGFPGISSLYNNIAAHLSGNIIDVTGVESPMGADVYSGDVTGKGGQKSVMTLIGDTVEKYRSLGELESVLGMKGGEALPVISIDTSSMSSEDISSIYQRIFGEGSSIVSSAINPDNLILSGYEGKYALQDLSNYEELFGKNSAISVDTDILGWYKESNYAINSVTMSPSKAIYDFLNGKTGDLTVIGMKGGEGESFYQGVDESGNQIYKRGMYFFPNYQGSVSPDLIEWLTSKGINVNPEQVYTGLAGYIGLGQDMGQQLDFSISDLTGAKNSMVAINGNPIVIFPEEGESIGDYVNRYNQISAALGKPAIPPENIYDVSYGRETQLSLAPGARLTNPKYIANFWVHDISGDFSGVPVIGNLLETIRTSPIGDMFFGNYVNINFGTAESMAATEISDLLGSENELNNNANVIKSNTEGLFSTEGNPVATRAYSLESGFGQLFSLSSLGAYQRNVGITENTYRNNIRAGNTLQRGTLPVSESINLGRGFGISERGRGYVPQSTPVITSLEQVSSLGSSFDLNNYIRNVIGTRVGEEGIGRYNPKAYNLGSYGLEEIGSRTYSLGNYGSRYRNTGSGMQPYELGNQVQEFNEYIQKYTQEVGRQYRFNEGEEYQYRFNPYYFNEQYNYRRYRERPSGYGRYRPRERNLGRYRPNEYQPYEYQPERLEYNREEEYEYLPQGYEYEQQRERRNIYRLEQQPLPQQEISAKFPVVSDLLPGYFARTVMNPLNMNPLGLNIPEKYTNENIPPFVIKYPAKITLEVKENPAEPESAKKIVKIKTPIIPKSGGYKGVLPAKEAAVVVRNREKQTRPAKSKQFGIEDPTKAINKMMFGTEDPTKAYNKMNFGVEDPTKAYNKMRFGVEDPTKVFNKMRFGSEDPIAAYNKMVFGNKGSAAKSNNTKFGHKNAKTAPKKMSNKNVHSKSINKGKTKSKLGVDYYYGENNRIF
jgi:hypothetical protein